MDADYRAQLEKVNEANAARFETRMDARFAEAESRTSERVAHVDACFTELIGKVDARFAASREELKRELAERFEAHTRWMMGGWALISPRSLRTSSSGRRHSPRKDPAGPRPPLRLTAHDRIDESVIRLTYIPA